MLRVRVLNAGHKSCLQPCKIECVMGNSYIDFQQPFVDLEFSWFFFFQFQELEQEKYHLRRRLQAAEEEYDLRVNELHADISSLRKSLDEATAVQRQSEKEKSLLITNLTEQNQRLTAQLREVIITCDNYKCQIIRIIIN